MQYISLPLVFLWPTDTYTLQLHKYLNRHTVTEKILFFWLKCFTDIEATICYIHRDYRNKDKLTPSLSLANRYIHLTAPQIPKQTYSYRKNTVFLNASQILNQWYDTYVGSVGTMIQNVYPSRWGVHFKYLSQIFQ